MSAKISRLTARLKKASLIAGGVLLAAVGLLLADLLLNPAFAPSAKTRATVQQALERQQKIEADIQAYYQSGQFTLTDPLVIQDPYQVAPLTALAIFDTPQEGQVSVHVPGDTPEAAVDFTFPGFQKHHEIPIYGLYAGRLNRVSLSLETRSGERQQTQVELQTEPLPVYVQPFHIDQVDRSRTSPGFNFPLTDHKQVFDLDGQVRWYSTQSSFQVATRLKNGHWLFTYTVGAVEGNLLMEQDLLGRIYAVYDIADGIHHDVIELPNGNYLATSSDRRSATVEDTLIEIGRSSGHVLRWFDLKKVLDPGRPAEPGNPANDWLHLNSIAYDPADRSIVISSKLQSAVVKLSYPGLRIRWILGPHDHWSQKFQPYLLTPSGTDFEWPWSQHDASLLAPETAGTVDVLLFDNGLYHSFDPAAARPPSEWYSMVVRYRVDESARTVQEVWEYGKSLGAADFSGTRGSAELLANGDILGTWGDITKDAEGNPSPKGVENGTTLTKIIEVDPADQTVVFQASAAGIQTYRTRRGGFYDGYSETNGFLSTRVNDTTGNDLYDRGELAWRGVQRWGYASWISIKDWARQLLKK